MNVVQVRVSLPTWRTLHPYRRRRHRQRHPGDDQSIVGRRLTLMTLVVVGGTLLQVAVVVPVVECPWTVAVVAAVGAADVAVGARRCCCGCSWRCWRTPWGRPARTVSQHCAALKQ